MPKQIALPDGTIGEFPDSMSDGDIAAILTKKFPPSAGTGLTDYAKEGANYASDIVGGLVSGINRGAAAIPGLPGSLAELAYGGDIPYLPNAQDTIQAWEGLSGKLPEQTTLPGKYAESVGEFIPGGGGASVARKVATAVAGGVGSKTLGDMTDSPWGNLIGGLLGTALSRGRKVRATSIAAEGAPTTAKVAEDTTRAYGDMFKLGGRDVAASNPAARRTLSNIKSDIGVIPPELAPKATALVKQFENIIPSVTPSKISMGGQGQVVRTPAVHPPLPLNKIEELRKQATAIVRSPANAITGVTDTDRHVAGTLIRHIDTLYENTALSILPKIEVARELGQRNILSKKLSEIERKAGWSKEEISRAKTLISSWGQGTGKAMPPLVQEAMQTVVHGTGFEKALSAASQLGRGKLGSAILYGGLSASPFTGLGTVAVGGWALGQLAKKLDQIAVDKSLTQAQKVILAGRARQEAARAAAASRNTQRDLATGGGVLGSLITSQTGPR